MKHLMLSAIVVMASTEITAAQTTLSYATNTAPTNVRGEAESIFLEELEKAAAGQLSITPYWGGSLVTGREILGAVRDGVADIGFVNINYYPNQLLINSAFNLFPEGPTDYGKIMAIYDDLYAAIPELDAEFADFNQRIIYEYGVLPFAGVFTSDVNTLEGMQGLRVRAASRWYLNLLEEAGATPVSAPWPDLYQMLQTKAIDGVFTNIDGIHRASLDEAAPNVLLFRELWIPAPFLITMNADKWESLSDEMKAAFETAADAARTRFGARYAEFMDEILGAQRAAGYKVTIAPAEAAAKIAGFAAVGTNRETWAAEAAEKGVTDPVGVLERFEKVIDDALGADGA